MGSPFEADKCYMALMGSYNSGEQPFVLLPIGFLLILSDYIRVRISSMYFDHFLPQLYFDQNCTSTCTSRLIRSPYLQKCRSTRPKYRVRWTEVDVERKHRTGRTYGYPQIINAQFRTFSRSRLILGDFLILFFLILIFKYNYIFSCSFILKSLKSVRHFPLFDHFHIFGLFCTSSDRLQFVLNFTSIKTVLLPVCLDQ